MPDFGEDVDEGGVLGQGVLTNAVLGLLVIVLIVGILFGLFAMSSYQGRWLYNAQTDQAQRVLDELEPKVENFKGVAETVKGLDADVVEYDKAADLAEKEISLDMSVLGTDKLLLGGERINMLTAYMVQAERLETMLEEHNRKTNKADKEELEKIAGGEEEQKEEKEVQYAAVFSFDHLNQTGKDPQKYEPKPGQIVKVPKEAEPGDDGKIEVEVPSSGQAVKVDVRGIVPLSRGQLLSVGGENAFGRYRQRVNEIKHVVKKLSQSPEALIERMRQLAERGSAPIFEF